MLGSTKPLAAGKPLSTRVSTSATIVPAMAPARLKLNDSHRIIRMMRSLRQPIARRMPISCVRSRTDMIIVFSMPTAPMIRAMAEVIQAIA